MADERIYRLIWGHCADGRGARVAPQIDREGWGWLPEEKEVSFLNKATGEILTFEYLGVEFTPWAPGWGFLILGKRLSPPVEES